MDLSIQEEEARARVIDELKTIEAKKQIALQKKLSLKNQAQATEVSAPHEDLPVVDGLDLRSDVPGSAGKAKD